MLNISDTAGTLKTDEATVGFRVVVPAEVRERMRRAKKLSGVSMAGLITDLVMNHLTLPGDDADNQ